MSTLVEPLGAQDHVFGPPDAPLTLLEYGDYECSFCGRAQREIATVLRREGKVIRFAFRQFPLTHLHPHALIAAQAAEAAGAQGKFWAMHEVLFGNQDALEPEDLLSYARSTGLDVPRFVTELEDGVHLSKVTRDYQTGARSGVRGTPTFFVNGRRHDGAWDANSLIAASREALPHEEGSPHQGIIHS